ncbi:MAG: CopG family transcriptional regulator [Chloroflexota bacterium]
MTRSVSPMQIYLRTSQRDALESLARRRGVSMAELVRQGVDRILRDLSPADDPLNEVIGLVKDDGPTDLAEKHDAYLEHWRGSNHAEWPEKSS